MVHSHLHILHLAAKTPDDKVNKVAEQRLKNLLIELGRNSITDYSIIEGFYDPKNIKQAIHKGHRQIVQLAKEQGLDNCIIAEDDIVFSSHNSYKYFLSQVPELYDLFCSLIYAGEVDGNRIKNGASGILSLYSIHSRFYDFFLSMDINNHVDRECGLTAFKHEYYVCQPEILTQRGGYSYNLKREMYYNAYLVSKSLYKG